jgi:hypothetical protein
MRIDQQRSRVVRLPKSEWTSARADQKLAFGQVPDSVNLNGTKDIIAALRGVMRLLFNRTGLTL